MECNVGSVECGVWSVRCGVEGVKCRVWSGERRESVKGGV